MYFTGVVALLKRSTRSSSHQMRLFVSKGSPPRQRSECGDDSSPVFIVYLDLFHNMMLFAPTLRFHGDTTNQHQPSDPVLAWLLSLHRRSADEWHQFKQHVWILSSWSVALGLVVREGCFACSTVAPWPSAILDSPLLTMVRMFFLDTFFHDIYMYICISIIFLLLFESSLAIAI